jgi:ABC-type transporter Mla subunit MlaD
MKLACFMFTLLAFTLQPILSYSQADTALQPIPAITEIPLQFIKNTNDKIDKYSNRLSSKTEKTLGKLTKFENRIHKLLLHANPTVANQLFGEGRQTFASMLAKVKEGKSLAENVKSKYDSYSDKLSTNIKYLETQKEQLDAKYMKPLTTDSQAKDS